MKSLLIYAGILAAAATLVSAETKKNQSESIAIAGKTISVKYAAPAVNGRVGKLFGKDGKIASDPTYPVWRAGADSATVLHTDAELTIGSLTIPKGDYTLYVSIANPGAWELAVNKQTGQWGTDYDVKQDVGRVKMTMTKPAAMIEQLKYTLSNVGGKLKLELCWENHVAAVTATVK